MEYNVHTLVNGIKVLQVPSASSIAHACLLINTGSRDEALAQTGLAHFIEHLIFKRTEKRSTTQILNRLETVGADLNAYTTKEYTCIHASFLQPYVDRTLELFNDIVFHSIFPEDELEKEKGVILDEISSYLDQPEEAVNDDFEDLLFAGHALGRNILGNPKSVSQLSRAHILDFMKDHYRTDEIVIAVLGNYSFKKIVRIAEKYFSAIPENSGNHRRERPSVLAPIVCKEEKQIMQAHIVMGRQAYDLHHPYKTGLLLLNNILGGAGMSSILNLQLREKQGIAYTIESNYAPLSDTGIFALYFGTDAGKVERATQLILKEFKKIRERPFTGLQLHRAKQKFVGQIALAEENRLGLLISMAKSLLDYGKIDRLEEVFMKINAVTEGELTEIARDMLDETRLSTLRFHPVD